MREQILAYAIKYQGEYGKIKKAIENSEKYERINYKGEYITILDEEYPRVFFELDEPPFILFYKGDLSLLDIEGIGVVGSRNCSQYGIDMCKVIVSKSRSSCIISGLAKGIDAHAHRFALEAYKNTIAIIGCGLDVIYPKENADLYEALSSQLILSEYPRNVAPLAVHFPRRNRLIAALSSKLVVVEASERSGTLLSVNEALTLNRDVYVVPYHYGETNGKGCNYLILQGANILYNEEDICEL